MLWFKRSVAVAVAELPSVLHFVSRWLSMQLGDASREGMIRSLEGVRGIACMTVMWFHLNLIMRSTNVWNPLQSNTVFSAVALAGAAGVTLFFVLSGFLLFMPFVKAMLFESKWPSTRRFYLRRALRIIPGYYFSLAILVLLTHPEYLHPDHLRDLGLFLTLFMDAPGTFMKINGPYWTLAIEWQFYLILPWLALGIGVIARRLSSHAGHKAWTVAGLLGGVMAWGVFSRYWGAYLLQHPVQTLLIPRPALNVFLFFLYGDSGKYLEDFAVGMLLSLCYVLVKQQASKEQPIGVSFAALKEKLYLLSPWFWGAGLLLLLFMALWHYDMWYPHMLPVLDGSQFWYNIASEWLLASGFGLCIAAILFGPAHLGRVFEWRPLRFMGLISYSLYIWHLPLLVLFMNRVGYSIASWNIFAVYGLYLPWIALAIIPFTYLCYRFIEKPWMNLGARWKKKA